MSSHDGKTSALQAHKEFRCHQDGMFHWLLPIEQRSNAIQVSAKLSDYHTQFRIQRDNNAWDLLSVYFGA